eukprot:Awhi_evm1s2877
MFHIENLLHEEEDHSSNIDETRRREVTNGNLENEGRRLVDPNQHHSNVIRHPRASNVNYGIGASGFEPKEEPNSSKYGIKKLIHTHASNIPVIAQDVLDSRARHPSRSRSNSVGYYKCGRNSIGGSDEYIGTGGSVSHDRFENTPSQDRFDNIPGQCNTSSHDRFDQSQSYNNASATMNTTANNKNNDLLATDEKEATNDLIDDHFQKSLQHARSRSYNHPSSTKTYLSNTRSNSPPPTPPVNYQQSWDQGNHSQTAPQSSVVHHNHYPHQESGSHSLHARRQRRKDSRDYFVRRRSFDHGSPYQSSQGSSSSHSQRPAHDMNQFESAPSSNKNRHSFKRFASHAGHSSDQKQYQYQHHHHNPAHPEPYYDERSKRGFYSQSPTSSNSIDREAHQQQQIQHPQSIQKQQPIQQHQHQPHEVDNTINNSGDDPKSSRGPRLLRTVSVEECVDDHFQRTFMQLKSQTNEIEDSNMPLPANETQRRPSYGYRDLGSEGPDELDFTAA